MLEGRRQQILTLTLDHKGTPFLTFDVIGLYSEALPNPLFLVSGNAIAAFRHHVRHLEGLPRVDSAQIFATNLTRGRLRPVTPDYRQTLVALANLIELSRAAKPRVLDHIDALGNIDTVPRRKLAYRDGMVSNHVVLAADKTKDHICRREGIVGQEPLL